MTAHLDELSEFQKDALRELGSIGAAHAATAMTQLVGRRINISVATAGLMKMNEVERLIRADEGVACIHLRLLGDAEGAILVLFPRHTALALSDILLGQKAGSTAFTEIAHSALLELGNILAGAYLTAISNLLGLLLLASVPRLKFDLTSVLADLTPSPDREGGAYTFVVHTEFRENDTLLSGHFLLAPDQTMVDALLRAIQRLVGGSPNGK